MLDVLDGSFSGQARVNRASFQVDTGRLLTGADSRSPWSMTNRSVESWLAKAGKNSALILKFYDTVFHNKRSQFRARKEALRIVVE